MHSEDARDVLDRYNRAKQIRSQRDNQWRLNAAYCLPRDYERWASGDANGQITPSGVDNAARAQFAQSIVDFVDLFDVSNKLAMSFFIADPVDIAHVELTGGTHDTSCKLYTSPVFVSSRLQRRRYR